MKQDEFTQTLSIEEIQAQCLQNFEKYRDQNTITTSYVPWVIIGNYGIFKIAVRMYQLFGSPVKWGYRVYVDGSAHSDSTDSMDSAISKAVKLAASKSAELDYEVDKNDDKRAKRDGKKRVLFYTSDKIGHTGMVSYTYIFQDQKLRRVTNDFDDQALGPFGLMQKMEDCYHFNLFNDSGFICSVPIYEDSRYNVADVLPDACNMLCTSQVAAEVKPILEKLGISVVIVHSEQMLMSSQSDQGVVKIL